MPEPAVPLDYFDLMGIARDPPSQDELEANPELSVLDEGRKARISARGIPDEPMPLLPREGFGYWVSVISDRVAHKWDAVIVIDGPEGSGKSTLALRLAVALDTGFTVKRICYTALDVMTAFKTCAPGDVIIFDESARALMGTDTFSKEQKALVQALMLVREKGLIVILCIPRIFELAKAMRSRRATMWIHVHKRGIGLVHVRDDRLNYKPDPQELGFSRSGRAPLLMWDGFKARSKLWAAYLVHKTAKLQEYLEETEALLAGRAGKGKGRASDHPDARLPGETVQQWEARRKRLRRQRNQGPTSEEHAT